MYQVGLRPIQTKVKHMNFKRGKGKHNGGAEVQPLYYPGSEAFSFTNALIPHLRNSADISPQAHHWGTAYSRVPPHHFLTTCPLPFGVAATAVETATRDSSVLLSVNARGPRLSCQVISIQRFFLSFSSWHTHQYLDEGQTVLIIHKAMYHNKLYYPSGVRKERQGQRCQ